jgi:hypothetical protein
LESSRTALYPAERSTLLLRVSDASGAPVEGGAAPTWTTSDPAVVSVTASGLRASQVVGQRVGWSTITATIDGRSASLTIVVVPTPSAVSSLLVVESFWMIEFEYPSAPGRWFYAPQIRLREPGNASGAAVTGVDFDIPGFGGIPSCRTHVPVPAGTTIDLFQEVYGDFQYTIVQPGGRAMGAVATAILTLGDGRGLAERVVVTGPIVPGELPTTYSSPTVWSCS